MRIWGYYFYLFLWSFTFSICSQHIYYFWKQWDLKSMLQLVCMDCDLHNWPPSSTFCCFKQCVNIICMMKMLVLLFLAACDSFQIYQQNKNKAWTMPEWVLLIIVPIFCFFLHGQILLLNPELSVLQHQHTMVYMICILTKTTCALLKTIPPPFLHPHTKSDNMEYLSLKGKWDFFLIRSLLRNDNILSK